MGQELQGDRAALGERMGGVHSVPGLRRGNPARDLLDQRESLNARYRRAVKALDHFPTEQAEAETSVMKTLPHHGRIDG